jgi:hypothetical protein
MTLNEAADTLVTFRNHLEALGVYDETIAEAIRLGGDQIPVFGTQLKGCYIRDNGDRMPHFAVPGWYRILHVEGKGVWIKKDGENTDPFEFYADYLLAVLEANLEYVAKGLNP